MNRKTATLYDDVLNIMHDKYKQLKAENGDNHFTMWETVYVKPNDIRHLVDNDSDTAHAVIKDILTRKHGGTNIVGDYMENFSGDGIFFTHDTLLFITNGGFKQNRRDKHQWNRYNIIISIIVGIFALAHLAFVIYQFRHESAQSNEVFERTDSVTVLLTTQKELKDIISTQLTDISKLENTNDSLKTVLSNYLNSSKP